MTSHYADLLGPLAKAQEELVQLPWDLVFGSKHSFGEADERPVWSR
jgi:hypothetical protein